MKYKARNKMTAKEKLAFIMSECLDDMTAYHMSEDLLKVITEKQAKSLFSKSKISSVSWNAYLEEAEKDYKENK